MGNIPVAQGMILSICHSSGSLHFLPTPLNRPIRFLVLLLALVGVAKAAPDFGPDVRPLLETYCFK